MIDRRTFLGVVGGGLAAGSLSFAAQAAHKKRLAVITTEW